MFTGKYFQEKRGEFKAPASWKRTPLCCVFRTSLELSETDKHIKWKEKAFGYIILQLYLKPHLAIQRTKKDLHEIRCKNDVIF